MYALFPPKRGVQGLIFGDVSKEKEVVKNKTAFACRKSVSASEAFCPKMPQIGVEFITASRIDGRTGDLAEKASVEQVSQVALQGMTGNSGTNPFKVLNVHGWVNE